MPQQKKRKRQNTGRFLNIVILLVVFLVVFEGKLLMNILKKESIQSQVKAQISELFAAVSLNETETETKPAKKEPSTEAPASETEAPRSSALVPKMDEPLDDSYFTDAVFIGDSRVEGLKNQSGITQGTFLTGVGMTASNIFDTPYISSPDGNITVYQAMYNTDYKKIYIMLGTNDLGEPDLDDFKEHYRIAIGELKKMAPNAILYIMGVAYVEESKVTTGDYVNNKNIKAVNEKILELCEENNYYYLDINEVLSDGNHSLIEGASSDGVHLYERYCILWLDYLKTHYISKPSSDTKAASSGIAGKTELNTDSQSNPVL